MAYYRKQTILPCFRAYLGTGNFNRSTNFGVGTADGFPFNTLEYIGSGSYNTTSCSYTVPVNGLYRFTTHINFYDSGGSAGDYIQFGFIINNTNSTYTIPINPAWQAGTTSSYRFTWSTIIEMNTNDTIKVYGDNVTDQITYYSGIGYCFFEGVLLTQFS